MCLGIALIVLAFLLAFTIYGEIAGVVGLAFVVTGAVMLGRRTPERSGAPGPPSTR
jgi:hypothetical protein